MKKMFQKKNALRPRTAQIGALGTQNAHNLVQFFENHNHMCISFNQKQDTNDNSDFTL